MSKMLSNLLQAAEPLFSISLQQLERSSGHPSTDVRLAAEIVGKAHMQMRSLGLDPNDTTGKELYHALLGLTAQHDEFLVRSIGGKDPEDVHALLPLLKRTVERIDVPKDAWVIKHSVAKRLLKACPPKKVMKALGYRSIDSMLKREPIAEIYGALRFVETSEWLGHFIEKYKKLTPADFETRRIEIVNLNTEKWGSSTKDFVQKRRHNVTHLKELGVVLLLPMPVKRIKGTAIIVLPLLLHYINEIRVYSAYFKMQHVQIGFGEILVKTLLNDPSHHAIMAGQPIHWRVIHRYYGKQDREHHPEIFEPHVQPEDLHWRKAEEVMYRLEPALHFWHDHDFVAVQLDKYPVSFNLMDMAVSYANQLPYGKHATYHFRESLWNEIYTRYLGHKSLEFQVLRQLDNRQYVQETTSFVNEEF